VEKTRKLIIAHKKKKLAKRDSEGTLQQHNVFGQYCKSEALQEKGAF